MVKSNSLPGESIRRKHLIKRFRVNGCEEQAQFESVNGAHKISSEYVHVQGIVVIHGTCGVPN